MPETTPNKWNKEKSPCWWVTNDIDSHSVVLDSVLIFIKNKVLHRNCLEFLQQLDIIDCIGKYFLIEKLAFC